jgi:menaquinone-dependent protoporphyrinogen oxidase
VDENNISRRDFLKTAGLALAATTVTGSALGYAATRRPDAKTLELEFGGEDNMDKRILVTYATRAGSTAEIAAAIGRSLGQRGFYVDVKPVKDRPDLEGYQAVILGSAIRMGSWLPEVVGYIQDNQEKLNSMPVALFTVHMLNTGDDLESRTNRLAYLDKVRPLLNGAEEVYFEGKMDFSKLSLFDRFIAKMADAVETDNRDWEKIRSWSAQVFA